MDGGLETIGNEVLSSAIVWTPSKLEYTASLNSFKKLMVSRFSAHHKY
jgi:hypothetical protein